MSQFKPTDFDQSINVTKIHPLKELVKLIAGLVVFVGILYLLLGITLELLIPRISIEAENRLWKVIYDTKFENSKLSDEWKETEKQMQAFFDSLPDDAKPEGYDFKIHIRDTEEINAHAYPGGHIVLTTGLLSALSNENGLTFTIGHELGHFAHRDHLRGMGRVAGTLLLGAVLFGQHGNSAIDFVYDIASVTDLSYSRKDEEDADSWGLKMVMLRYGHAGGADGFFKLVNTDNSLFKNPELFSTHPITQKRIDTLKQTIYKNSYPTRNPAPPFWKE